MNSELTYELIDNIITLFDNNLNNISIEVNNIKNKYEVSILNILHIMRFVSNTYFTHLRGNYLNYEKTHNLNIQKIIKNGIIDKLLIFKPTSLIKPIKKDKYNNIIDKFINIITNISNADIIYLSHNFFGLDNELTGSIKSIIEYAIIYENWDFFEYFMHHENSNYFLIIVKFLLSYLTLLPYNIFSNIMKIYKDIEGNKFHHIKMSYYISSKLKNTKFIDFEDFDELYINKLKYTVLLLNTDNHIIIKNNDEKIIKYYNILNKLHLDLQLKICGLTSVNINDIKRSIKYLIKIK